MTRATVCAGVLVLLAGCAGSGSPQSTARAEKKMPFQDESVAALKNELNDPDSVKVQKQIYWGSKQDDFGQHIYEITFTANNRLGGKSTATVRVLCQKGQQAIVERPLTTVGGQRPGDITSVTEHDPDGLFRPR